VLRETCCLGTSEQRQLLRGLGGHCRFRAAVIVCRKPSELEPPSGTVNGISFCRRFSVLSAMSDCGLRAEVTPYSFRGFPTPRFITRSRRATSICRRLRPETATQIRDVPSSAMDTNSFLPMCRRHATWALFIAKKSDGHRPGLPYPPGSTARLPQSKVSIRSDTRLLPGRN
jgi:hypothetical protein